MPYIEATDLHYPPQSIGLGGNQYLRPCAGRSYEVGGREGRGYVSCGLFMNHPLPHYDPYTRVAFFDDPPANTQEEPKGKR